jgi:SAM-dependent methyltransferase
VPELVDKLLSGYIAKRMIKPTFGFLSYDYQRHNMRRLEHLASLDLNIAGKSVLEIGAGIGDHTSFFLDRGCSVTITEPRQDNREILKMRFPSQEVLSLDLEHPTADTKYNADIVYCYGVLYHLQNPEAALRFMRSLSKELLLLETCVSYTDNGQANLCAEDANHTTQAFSGTGCRPARSFIFKILKELFPYVYLPKTQPWHKEFPLDWTLPETPGGPYQLTRAIFIGSTAKLEQKSLVDYLPEKYTR